MTEHEVGKLSIFLVDDHVSFCEGLVSALNTLKPEYEIEHVSDAEFVPA